MKVIKLIILVLFLLIFFQNFAQNFLVIVAHPVLEKSQINQQLVKAVSDDKTITVHDLYKLYPDEKITILAEQNLIKTHDIIVFQFPLYWFSAPSLLKKWQDEVITSKFVLGNENPLKGKKLLLAVSAGGTQEDFRHGALMNTTIDEVLAPFEAFANLCGMKYLPPFVSFGVPNPEILEISLSEEDKKVRKEYIEKQAKNYYLHLQNLIKR